jgi:selenocysteine lyase/cysteine desulfurase
MTLDKARAQARIHELNTVLKEGLAAMDQVRLYTPVDARLSSGITCFNIEGIQRGEVVRPPSSRPADPGWRVQKLVLTPPGGP